MAWKYVHHHIVVLGCPFVVHTFCNGEKHIMIQPYYLQFGRIEECYHRHQFEEEVTALVSERLDEMLAGKRERLLLPHLDYFFRD